MTPGLGNDIQYHMYDHTFSKLQITRSDRRHTDSEKVGCQSDDCMWSV